jgi:hypothetical protein
MIGGLVNNEPLLFIAAGLFAIGCEISESRKRGIIYENRN